MTPEGLRIRRNAAGQLCCVFDDQPMEYDGEGTWRCTHETDGERCSFMVFRDERGNEPGHDSKPFKWTPDEDLLKAYEDLEEDQEYTVRVHCIGHPFGSGGGCGWEGIGRVRRGKAEHSSLEGGAIDAVFMPQCGNCGGWAEPKTDTGKLMVVK